MADYPVLAALEIGTSRIKVLVGERIDAHKVRIIGQGIRDSAGVRKGSIVNLNQAGAMVQYALDDAADTSQTNLLQVYLSTSGGAIGCDVNTVGELISSTGIVDAELCEALKEESAQMDLPEGRQLIHGVGMDFSLDEQTGVDDPIGRSGRYLAHTSLIIHGNQHQIGDAIRVVEQRRCSVSDVVFSGLCDTYAVLTPAQRRQGVLLIDFGGGVTEYMVVIGNRIRHAGTLAVGGEHITNDIALGFHLPFESAEQLKLNHGSALVDGNVDRLAVPKKNALAVGDPQTINTRALQTIIEARVSEIFDIIRREVVSFLPELNAGVVVTGGGAHLPRILDVATKVFGRRSMIGLPFNLEWDEKFQPAPELATVAGLLVYATHATAGKSASIKDFFKGLFGK